MITTFLIAVVAIALTSVVGAIAMWKIDERQVMNIPIPAQWHIDLIRTEYILLRAERILGNVRVQTGPTQSVLA